jgi:predicted restriction endonuclease
MTGLAVPELVRASHIKPWAACGTDAERLDVYSGPPLAPQLAAAFDAGSITVADDGEILVSPGLSVPDRRWLWLDARLRVDDLASEHRTYLAWH